MAEEIILSKDVSENINSVLKEYVRNTGVRCVLLISKSGQLISENGFTSGLKMLSIAALISSVFNSSQKLASLLKEKMKEFFIEGKIWNIHYLQVTKELVFASLFKKNILLGVVKAESKHITKEINRILQNASKPVNGMTQSKEGDEKKIYEFIERFFQE